MISSYQAFELPEAHPEDNTTVMNCDVLFYMDEGRIVGKGGYVELLQRNLHFREMGKEVKSE